MKKKTSPSPQKIQQKNINKLFGSANKKCLNGQFDQALTELKKILDLNGSHVEALTLAGEIYGKKGDIENAWLCFNTALKTKPTDDRILTFRGEANKLKGQTEQAMQDFILALQINSQNVLTLSLRGELFKSLNFFKKALADFNRILALEPNNVFALTQRGDTYAFMREFDKAYIDYERALHIDNNYQDVFFFRANAYKMQGDFKKALENLQRIEQEKVKSKNLLHFFFMRAEIYKELKEWQIALDNINIVLGLAPKNVIALALRGNIHTSMNNYENGLRDYNNALGILDNEPLNSRLKAETLTDRAELYLLQSLKNIEHMEAHLLPAIENKASLDLAEALSLAPSYFRAVTFYWGIKKKNYLWNEALDIANAFLKNNPENIPIYMIRGLTHKELGNFDEAILDFEHALTVEPKNINLHEQIAEIRAMQQKNQKTEVPSHSLIVDVNEELKSEEYSCNQEDYNDELVSEEYTVTQSNYSDNEDNEDAFSTLSKTKILPKTNSTQNLLDIKETTRHLTRASSSYKLATNNTQKQTFFSAKNSRNMKAELKNGSIKIQEKLNKFFSHTKKSKNNIIEPSWFNGRFNAKTEGIMRIEDPTKQRFILLNASKDQTILTLLDKKIKKGGFNRTKDLRRLDKSKGQYFCDINIPGKTPGKEKFEKKQFIFEVKFAGSEDRILAVVIPDDDKRAELLIPLYYQSAFHTNGTRKAMRASCPKISIEWPQPAEKIDLGPP